MIRPPMPCPRALVLAPLAAVLALTACGEPAPVDVGGSTIELTLDDYRITPQNVRIRAGDAPLRLVARNEGRLQHNVKIESLTKTDSAGTPIVLGGTPTGRPGQTITATVALEPGTYRLVCTLGNHDNLGQYGELVVEPRRGGG
jgi:plastocyanin